MRLIRACRSMLHCGGADMKYDEWFVPVLLGVLGALLILVVLAGLLYAQQPAPAPACGEGPHELRVSRLTPCPNRCRDSYERQGTAYVAISWCNDLPCSTLTTEQWTDWPECGGTRIMVPQAQGGGTK